MPTTQADAAGRAPIARRARRSRLPVAMVTIVISGPWRHLRDCVIQGISVMEVLRSRIRRIGCVPQDIIVRRDLERQLFARQVRFEVALKYNGNLLLSNND